MNPLTAATLCSPLPAKTAEVDGLAEFSVSETGNILYFAGRLKNRDGALAVYKVQVQNRADGEVQVPVKTTLARRVKSIGPQSFKTALGGRDAVGRAPFGSRRKIVWTQRPEGFPDGRQSINIRLMPTAHCRAGRMEKAADIPVCWAANPVHCHSGRGVSRPDGLRFHLPKRAGFQPLRNF